MKYYSEELRRFFDTEEKALAAEQEAIEKKESAKVTKAKYAKKIEDCEKSVDKSVEEYHKILKDVDNYRQNHIKELNEIKVRHAAEIKHFEEEYYSKIKSLLEPASDKVKKAMADKTKAIQDFNKEFGVYTTTYTGDRAVKELEKTLFNFDTLFDDFWMF